jgi:hypothetical protein
MKRIALKTIKSKADKIESNSGVGLSGVGLSIKPKQVNKPEFYVSDEYGNFFCMYRNGYPYWSKNISEARELTEETQFNTLVRWESGIRKLKQEWL